MISETADTFLKIKGDIQPERENLLQQMMELNPGDALTFYEQKVYLSGLLRRCDRMSMMNSIEARVPFLDYRLVNKG